jgi:DNA-binding transcriptional ArsR family regulator
MEMEGNEGMPSEEIDNQIDDLSLKLSGRTFVVYLYLLTQREPKNRREVKDSTGLSSISHAGYHLKKLEDMQLVEQNDLGEYHVIRNVDVGILGLYTKLRTVLIPRFVFYLVLYCGTLVCLLLGYKTVSSIQLLIITCFLTIFGIVTSLYEIVNLMNAKPLR